ncbi:hypothetical protein D3C85_1528540 [compost metagenome]
MAEGEAGRLSPASNLLLIGIFLNSPFSLTGTELMVIVSPAPLAISVADFSYVCVSAIESET